MFSSRRIFKTTVCALLASLMVASSSADDIIINNATTIPPLIRSEPSAGPTIPSSPSDPSSQKGLWPMVQVDRANNKSVVDVHVPIFFDMTNEHGDNQSKLDLSVLSGLVTVSRDKARKPNGQQVGPVTVTVFGIPIYSGLGSSASRGHTGRKIRSDNDTMPSALRSDHDTREELKSERPIVMELYDQYLKMQQRATSSISDLFSKFSHTIGQRAQPFENVNGGPADRRFHKPSTFTKQDLVPKNQSDVQGSALEFKL